MAMSGTVTLIIMSLVEVQWKLEKTGNTLNGRLCCSGKTSERLSHFPSIGILHPDHIGMKSCNFPWGILMLLRCGSFQIFWRAEWCYAFVRTPMGCWVRVVIQHLCLGEPLKKWANLLVCMSYFEATTSPPKTLIMVHWPIQRKKELSCQVRSTDQFEFSSQWESAFLQDAFLLLQFSAWVFFWMSARM